MAGIFDTALSMLGKVAGNLAPQLSGAVRGAPKLLEAAKSVSAAFSSLKEANGNSAPADAEAAHDALFEKVKAHASRTFDRAEGR